MPANERRVHWDACGVLVCQYKDSGRFGLFVYWPGITVARGWGESYETPEECRTRGFDALLSAVSANMKDSGGFLDAEALFPERPEDSDEQA